MSDNSLSLSSTSPDHKFIELPADGIYIWDFGVFSELTRVPYPAETNVDGHKLEHFSFTCGDQVKLQDLLTCKELYNDLLHRVSIVEKLLFDTENTTLWKFHQNISCPEKEYAR